MPEPFKASLITPEAIVLESPVVAAQVPAFDGLVGILNHRAPLLAKMGTGVLRLDTVSAGGGVVSQRFMVDGGYAQMKGDGLTILTTEAIPAEKITQQSIAAEQTKLGAIQGVERQAMEKRSAIQARIFTMRSILGTKS